VGKSGEIQVPIGRIEVMTLGSPFWQFQRFESANIMFFSQNGHRPAETNHDRLFFQSLFSANLIFFHKLFTLSTGVDKSSKEQHQIPAGNIIKRMTRNMKAVVKSA
jgi:hypothetical protein